MNWNVELWIVLLNSSIYGLAMAIYKHQLTKVGDS